MLQYIINSTAIWMIGWAAFELFFRKEPYHGYNRFYLLTTLAAGIFIPLWSWDYDSVIYTAEFSRPIIERTYAIQENITQSQSTTQVTSLEQWPGIIYITGVLLTTLLLLKDILLIRQYSRKGKHSKDGTWTIIETGQSMSPFSAFRYIFISSKENYTLKELEMTLLHEEQHGHLLHFLDVLFLRICTIIFWFNPFVYLLKSRLLVVHEYQADAVIQEDTSIYSRFLVEQSMLNAAPQLAHSFTRSPLKRRIKMLTRKAGRMAKGKQILIAPVLIIGILLFTKHAFSIYTPVQDGDKYSFRGNIIEYSKTGRTDTVQVEEAGTGKKALVLTVREPYPILFNGEKVYQENELTNHHIPSGYSTFVSQVKNQVIMEYLLTNLDKEISKLPDGEYELNIYHLVVDKQGKIAFFRLGDVKRMIKEKDGIKRGHPIDKRINERFINKIAILLNNAPKHRPAWYEGYPVHSLVETGYYNPFIVKDGKLESL